MLNELHKDLVKVGVRVGVGDGAASLFSSAKWETTFNLRNPGV